MASVEFGKVWKATSKEEAEKIFLHLEDCEFVAKMSDDYKREREEIAEIRRQQFALLDLCDAMGW